MRVYSETFQDQEHVGKAGVVEIGWFIERFHREKYLRPLKHYLQGTPNEAATNGRLEGVELEKRRAEHDKLVRGMKLDGS